MESGKIVLGVMGGVAAGALLGILFAPYKGSKTRRKIVSKAQDYVEDLKDNFDESLASVTEKYEDLLVEAKSLVASKEEVK